jgi:hypothetical protein
VIDALFIGAFSVAVVAALYVVVFDAEGGGLQNVEPLAARDTTESDPPEEIT